MVHVSQVARNAPSEAVTPQVQPLQTAAVEQCLGNTPFQVVVVEVQVLQLLCVVRRFTQGGGGGGTKSTKL